MIESLNNENLGVIEEADLILSPGLTALTGETGALNQIGRASCRERV